MKNRKGLSLIELTIVLALMGILMTMFTPIIRSDFDRRFAQQAANEIHWLMNAAKHARNYMMNSGNAIWLDIEEMKSAPIPFLPVGWTAVNPYGNPYRLPDFESNKPAAQAANVFRIRTQVIPSIRDYMLKMLPFAEAIGDDEILVTSPVPGSEPGWINKLSIYPGSPVTERTVNEQVDFLDGLIARANTLINRFEDLDDNNYYVDPDGTTHLRRLIVDEFQVDGASVFNGPITINANLTLDDLVCNNLTVLQNTSANIGSWSIYGGNIVDVSLVSGEMNSLGFLLRNIPEYGDQPAELVYNCAIAGRD